MKTNSRKKNSVLSFYIFLEKILKFKILKNIEKKKDFFLYYK